jgi:hypothetical protein
VIEAEGGTDICLAKTLNESLTENPLSPAHAGSRTFSALIPHAHAWGYMLPPASQAR